LEQQNIFTNEYLKVDRFLSGITNISFHSIKTMIIAEHDVDGEMNNIILAIVYANTAAASLGFISSTIHLSPRRRIGRTASDDSPRNEGQQSGDPIRGRNRGHNHGRGHIDHGFTQRGESTTMTWGTNP
jgi:hypothetical protein